MNSLFDKTSINGMVLNNRFVRSATWEGMCEKDGRPTQKLINLYTDLAEGNIGLIITGYTYIRPDGKQSPGKMGLYSNEFEADMKKLVKAVHSKGGKICIQLVHAGGQTDSTNAGKRPIAPSSVAVKQFPEIPEEITKDEIDNLVKAFGYSARKAKDYGFDAVQMHGAHGYLINQFLSPHTNKRNDEYGGNIENRCRFLMEVYQSIRKEVGDDFPVLIKLNASDNMSEGLNPDDALIAAKKLDEAGIDAIEVSAGTSASGNYSPARRKIDSPDKERYNLDLAKNIKKSVNCPVMVVGGFRSFDIAEKAVTESAMDYISLSRPFIREPDLINRWQQGDHSPAKCISCNGCFVAGYKEGGIYCVQQLN
ncbi:NADH:flavin oxidoreductase [Bacteroidota bacterium]